ncbi:MAG: HEPN domain-containing protein [Acidobacteriia bacterium]|nr:HEPN domain-containing protein [Terriglobia bacterium]
MPPDPATIEDTRSWLKKAITDLRGATIDLEASPPLIEDALFHAQQAVEKALKALLTFHDRPFRKTHSLEELGEACLQIDAALRRIIDDAVPLTEYAWAFRYPGTPETPGLNEAQAALAVAIRVVDAILSRIPPAAHP